MSADWLTVRPGEAPLIVSMPHTGTDIPADIEATLASPWIGRKDADWHIDKLYAFAADLGATIVRTGMSRTVIDVNRDPTGASLYPGQTTTFEGEPLYAPGRAPDEAEIDRRLATWFRPYHAALSAEIERLRTRHAQIVLYEAHSILSRVPRLFDGELPQFNIGTNGGTTCAPALADAVAQAVAPHGSHVVDGRFRGGWTTRHYGRPETGVHAIQMELAMRGYLDEPADLSPETWPVPYDAARAAPIAAVLRTVLERCIAFAKEPA